MRSVEQEAVFFEERAENLSDEQFELWTAPTPHDAHILKQLMSQGPKLLSGPRGCGKSTLLRTANVEMLKRQVALPVFVNYGKSMFIEPAFRRRADADAFFQDWLVARLLDAADRTLRGRLKQPVSAATELGERARDFIDRAEADPMAPRADFPGPSALALLLESWAVAVGMRRVVLLLDDAAHAFVPEQQRIFFEFLRNVRTPTVTFKAAIYPGVTEFSPNFHVGHDAKIVHAWMTVEGPTYIESMRGMLDRRLPTDQRTRINGGVADLFAAASFGIPRTFFNMVEAYLELPLVVPGRLTRVTQTILTENADQLRLLHRSLAAKLPRFKHYVEVGEQVLDCVVGEIRRLNEERASKDGQTPAALDIAVRHPIDARLETIFGLLEYAGLIRRTNESISLGAEGTYTKFAVHGSLLVAGAALKFGKNPTLDQRAKALVRSSRSGSFKRVGSEVLLPKALADSCALVVANCSSCGASRSSPDARFCSLCGSELVTASRFEELLRAPIELLPLPRLKKEALEDKNFATIEDLLRDRGLSQIRKVKSVGTVWARRIYTVAEEFVGV